MPVGLRDDVHPAGAARPGGVDVWDRWMPAWHLYNGAVVAFSTVVALWGSDLAVGSLAIVAICLTALAVAYILIWMQTSAWGRHPLVRIGYGILLLALYGVLATIQPAFQFLQFSLYAQLFFSLPSLRSAVIGGLSVGVIAAATIGLRAHGDLAALFPEMAANVLVAAAFTMLSAWITAIIAQSTDRQELLAQLATTRADLAAAEREAGILEERARLSREIHDTLAQGFASVVTQLEAADAQLLPSPERARGHLRAAEEVARASLEEARGLVWALRPGTLQDGGLPAAIQRAAAAAAPVPAPGESPTAVDVTVAGQPRQLATDVEVTLLRSAQEAMANALRHAHASRVTVTLTYFDDAVSLDVIDDGAGFDPSAVLGPGPAGGHGLPGMRERAERLGGHLDVESAPGDGTVIALQLPLPAAQGGTP
jgi:signal transduction histidine kinase